ncbi:oligosaccharide flippase family protein [Ramlibacter humi]|uniref:Uncharacterized protein n=1 Tax=Ramlibacter humi TaxID=2530451 RepID=A0A4Z0C0R6_9BURK|nr:polysaccharide biosynthesis C-terminal domain-containing protein [Ramlibacter humi]TFZ03829.1 hypothetical protein EZ216_09260 [Ramlibacter humi]
MKSLIERAVHSLRHQKLSRDIAFTLGSFVVLAVSGIVINIVVTALRDAAALGVFNLAYAVYIVASQFAVWGLHYSVLRHAAFYEKDAVERGHMLVTASACALGMGVVAAVAVALAEPLFQRAFSSEATGAAIRNASIGLLLFPLNKVLLAYLNGLRLMKAFSVLQGLRYLIVMIAVAAIAASSLPIEMTTFCFVVAELVTALAAVAYLGARGLLHHLRVTRAWVRRHYVFGTKGLAAGMFAEVNSRVDVLMIGFFLSDRATGIYSFAAMLVDGLYHVLAMVRINFNPMLVGALRDRDWAAALKLREQSRVFVLPVTLVLGIGLLVAYWVLAGLIMPAEKGLMEGMPSLAILLAGLICVSFLVPFDNLLMVTGHPGYQTGQQVAAVLANVVVAWCLLPIMGIEGAALGTAASYLVSTGLLVYLARRVVGWNLVANTFKG